MSDSAMLIQYMINMRMAPITRSDEYWGAEIRHRDPTSSQVRIAGVPAAVTAAIASAAALPAFAGSASQAKTSGDVSTKSGMGNRAFRM